MTWRCEALLHLLELELELLLLGGGGGATEALGAQGAARGAARVRVGGWGVAVDRGAEAGDQALRDAE